MVVTVSDAQEEEELVKHHTQIVAWYHKKEKMIPQKSKLKSQKIVIS